MRNISIEPISKLFFVKFRESETQSWQITENQTLVEALETFKEKSKEYGTYNLDLGVDIALSLYTEVAVSDWMLEKV